MGTSWLRKWSLASIRMLTFVSLVRKLKSWKGVMKKIWLLESYSWHPKDLFSSERFSLLYMLRNQLMSRIQRP